MSTRGVVAASETEFTWCGVKNCVVANGVGPGQHRTHAGAATLDAREWCRQRLSGAHRRELRRLGARRLANRTTRLGHAVHAAPRAVAAGMVLDAIARAILRRVHGTAASAARRARDQELVGRTARPASLSDASTWPIGRCSSHSSRPPGAALCAATDARGTGAAGAAAATTAGRAHCTTAVGPPAAAAALPDLASHEAGCRAEPAKRVRPLGGAGGRGTPAATLSGRRVAAVCRVVGPGRGSHGRGAWLVRIISVRR